MVVAEDRQEIGEGLHWVSVGQDHEPAVVEHLVGRGIAAVDWATVAVRPVEVAARDLAAVEEQQPSVPDGCSHGRQPHERVEPLLPRVDSSAEPVFLVERLARPLERHRRCAR